MTLVGLGFTALWPGIGIFPDWVRRREFGIQTRVVEVSDGVVHWSDKVKLPVRPMIGVIGVAPVHGAVLTVDNGPHGGNLDIQEVTSGNSVMMRVHRDGAHLFLGDCHAIQGDGEVNGMGAIEIAADLKVRVGLSPAPDRLNWPRIETPTHLCTTGCARPLEDAMRIAFEEMVFWLEDDYGIPAAEAYMLLGQIAEARCTQMVNPKYTYICKVPKSILAAYG
jgi:acetamidase/formamidase